MADVAPVDDVILHEQEGEAFLLHVPTGKYFGLNRTGLVVWKALVAGEDPVAQLGARWPDVPDDVRRVVVPCLAHRLLPPPFARTTG